MDVTKLFWVTLFVLLPGLAPAEGASQVLNCQAVSSCDAAGICAYDGSDVRFEISPVDVGDNGEGQYEIAYGGRQFDMHNITGFGPMVWAQTENDVQTLLPSGKNQLVWHRLRLDEPLSATTVYLTCQGVG